MTVSPGTILLSFRLIAWCLPAPSLESVTDLSLDELKEKYRSRDRWGNLLFPIPLLGLAFLYWILLDLARNQIASRWSTAKYFVTMSAAVLPILAFFMSVASSFFVVFIICRWILGCQEWKVYSTYGCYASCPRMPFDMIKFYQWTFWVGFPLLIVTSAVLIDQYTAFTDTALVHNSALSLGVETKHFYSEVRRVYEIRGFHWLGKYQVSPYEFILFDDGTSWTSDQGAGGVRLDEFRKCMQFVAEKSGKEYIEVESIEAIPQP